MKKKHANTEDDDLYFEWVHNGGPEYREEFKKIWDEELKTVHRQDKEIADKRATMFAELIKN